MNETKLSEILNYAANNIEYYKYLNNSDLILENFPILKKIDYLENFDKFISKDIKFEDIITEITSGSTGIPFKCIKSKYEQFLSQMYIWSWRQEFVEDIFNSKLMVFSSSFSQESELDFINKNNKEFLIDEKAKSYYNGIDFKFITPRNIMEVDINKLVTYISDYRPDWIRTTPTNIIDFCNRIKKLNITNEFNSIKFIEVSGETLLSVDRKIICEVFKNAYIGDHYGSREVWPIAYECKFGIKHICEEHVFCELVKMQKYENGFGELCITALEQKTFPFIRYNIGDICKIRYLECNCGKSGLILEEVQGRIGGLVSIADKTFNSQVLSQFFKEAVVNKDLNIKRFKFIKKGERNLSILVESDNDIEAIIEEYVKKYLMDKLNVDIDITVNIVKDMFDEYKDKRSIFIDESK